MINKLLPQCEEAVEAQYSRDLPLLPQQNCILERTGSRSQPSTSGDRLAQVPSMTNEHLGNASHWHCLFAKATTPLNLS
ncbi:hypothetical protein [Nodosilinea sp. FACHB-13]|uniref:hypothetical protein n=1 Tax=Cyanophyceae TaxID=3028117 RepID=UPI0016827CBA|nr:hypothetical protein [Nodosilinea sp. FACHB-13]MBD2107968.1 hypothetical protein [Nodosilinea sp. FACHB-13]